MTISGASTVTNALDYVGPLYGISREDTPLLSAIGGINGGEITPSMVFGWQTYDLRTASQPSVVEGAAAPTAQGRTRSFAFNITQIAHEAVETTWSKKMYSGGQFATTGSAHPGAVGLPGTSPVKNEHNWQTIQMLKQIANDAEYSIIRGSFSQPADSTTARQTRGLLEAIATNATAKGTAITNITGEADDEIFTKSTHGLLTGDQLRVDSVTGGTGSGLAAGSLVYVGKIDANTFYLYTDYERTSMVTFTTDISDLDVTKLDEPTAIVIIDLLQTIWDNGGLREGETRTLVCNSGLKRYLTKLFIDNSYTQNSRSIGGTSVDTIESDFGRLNIMLDHFMPRDTLMAVSLGECRLKWGVHPDYGARLIKVPVGNVGSSDKDQFYGEYGLEYGNQRHHGKITGLHFGYHPAS